MTALARIEALLSRLVIQPASQPTITAASSTDREWLTAAEVAQLFGISVKALYSDVVRGGRFADAVSRVGKRLRFSRRGLDRLPLRKPGRRSHVQERVPSPGGSERW